MLPTFLIKLNRFFRPTIVKGSNNSVIIESKRHDFVIRIYGDNNTIKIGPNSRLKNTLVNISGENNRLIAEPGSKFDGPCEITLEGNATLYIGANSGIRGVCFVAKDGAIRVGRNCMFSYGIVIRNNDAHKVLDNDGYITNLPRDITIKDHVWLCERCAILKGVTIGEDSIVAFGAIVTKSCPPNSILAGNPAMVVKQSINWLNK